MKLDDVVSMVETKNTPIKHNRDSNLELYRIFVMLLIVAHHYVVNSDLADCISNKPFSTNSIFYLIFGAWGKTGINCFVLITGYFMCKSEISLRKFLKLILWVLTYSIIITGIFIICGYTPFGTLKMCWEVVPLTDISNGFTSGFLMFFLTIPFLNILIHNITQRQHIYLIVLLLFIYTLHGSIPGFYVMMNYVSWFITLYFISSYLKLYPLTRDKDTCFWGYMTVLSWSISVSSVVVFSLLQAKYTNSIELSKSYFFVSDSNAILAFTNGITSFMWFKNLRINNSKIINTIAASSFGVLLIHANSDTMRQWLWKDTIDCVGHYDVSYYWLYAIGCVFAIFSVCTIIDIIRIKTIETPLLNMIETLCLKIFNKSIR